MNDPAIILDALEVHAKQNLRRAKGQMIFDLPQGVFDSRAMKERIFGLDRAIRCAAAMEEILMVESRDV